MRDIKFRARRKLNGNWVYGCLILNGNGEDWDFIIPIHADNSETDYWQCGGCARVISETIGQFTGLKDKNAKEIYEGDIVRWATDWDYTDTEYQIREFKKGKKAHSYVGVVEWEQGEFAHYVINPKRMNLTNESFLIEIIGNKYEHPELLK